MDLSQFLLILKAHLKLILTIFFSILITTIVVSLILPKTYQATTSLVLNYKGMDPVTGVVLPAQLMPGYMATQVDVITSRKVAAKVVEDLRIDENLEANQQYQEEAKLDGMSIRDWYAEKLLKYLEVNPSRESSVIDISFSNSDPRFAAAVANAYARAYLNTNVQLKAEPAQRAAGFLGDQTKRLRDELQSAQAKLLKYQREKEITGSSGNLDVENAKLNQLSSQYITAQAELSDASSRSKYSSPDIAVNPVVQSLKISLSKAEADLSDYSQQYDTNHPKYLAAKAEVDKIRQLLGQEVGSTSGRVVDTAKIATARLKDLEKALFDQKNHVLELNLTRNELSTLEGDVLNAQRALDAASQRQTQATLEGNSNQSDVSVLNLAIPPDSPKSPKLLLNTFLACFMGLIFGVGTALMLEVLNRKVRSRDDLADLLEVPVFSIVDHTKQHDNAKKLINSNKLIGYKGA